MAGFKIVGGKGNSIVNSVSIGSSTGFEISGGSNHLIANCKAYGEASTSAEVVTKFREHFGVPNEISDGDIMSAINALQGSKGKEDLLSRLKATKVGRLLTSKLYDEGSVADLLVKFFSRVGG